MDVKVTDGNRSAGGKVAKVKVMVTLRGFGESTAASAAASVAASTAESAVESTAVGATSDYAARRAQYAARKSEAKRQRDEVVEWLKANKGSGSYRRASDATVFGTFTLEATPDVVALLHSAPHVESVIPVEEMPLTLLDSTVQ